MQTKNSSQFVVPHSAMRPFWLLVVLLVIFFHPPFLFSRVHETLEATLSVGRSICLSVGPLVGWSLIARSTRLMAIALVCITFVMITVWGVLLSARTCM